MPKFMLTIIMTIFILKVNQMNTELDLPIFNK